MAKKFTCSNIPERSFKHFNELRCQNQLCDVTIHVRNKSIFAHRIVLTAVIPYFRNLFCSKNNDGDVGITIPDIEPDAFTWVIEYAYTCEININAENVRNLLTAACFLEIKEVQEACCDFLYDTMEPQNAQNIRELALILGCSKLLKITDLYVRENFSAVSQTRDFLNCDVVYLKELIATDDLKVDSESRVLDAVLRWVKECPDERKNELPELLLKVRMPLVDPVYLTDIVETEQLVETSIPCRNLIDEARNYTFLPQRRKAICSFQTVPRKLKRLCDNPCIYKFEGQAMYKVQHFDMQREKWITRELDLFSMEAGSTAELNGKIYFFRWGDTVQFSPVNNEYEYKNHMPTARLFAGAAAFKNKIYVCGGMRGDCEVCSAVECFDPEENKWTKVSLMPAGHWGLSVVTLGEHIYIMGGKLKSVVCSSMERYDPQLNEWKYMSSMLTERYFFGAAALHNKIYVCGGVNSAGEKMCLIKTAEVYDLNENRWVYIAPMNTVRYDFTLLTLQGKLYAIGGENSDGKWVHDFEIYDLEKDEWICGPSTDSECITSGAVVMEAVNMYS